jgi:hypothetical protein
MTVALTLGAALFTTLNTRAESGDALLNKLVEKGFLTQREANGIRAQMGSENKETVETYGKTKVPGWIDQMKWEGDLRLRAENFDFEKNPTTGVKLQDDRLRYRVRARFGFESKFQDWATIGLRLASGGADPVSTNQSFENTFERKAINIDLAYVTLQPPTWKWISVTGGKMKNPIWQTGISSPLQYDHDVTPEGLAEQLTWKFGDKEQHTLFANLGQFVLDEVSGNVNDEYLFEFQGGIEAKFKRVKAKVAGGYYFTHNLELMGIASGNQPSGATTNGAQTTSPNRGNTAQLLPAVAGTLANGPLGYLEDFKVLTARGEVAWSVSDKPLWGGTPFLLTFSAEYITNMASAYENSIIPTAALGTTAIGDETEGYSFQIALGEAKKKGQWQVAYQYKYLEADATWDSITDSDWGSGGTDRRGSVIKAAYNLQDWWQLGCTVFMSDKISNRSNGSGALGRPYQQGWRGEDMTRIQLDTVFKF